MTAHSMAPTTAHAFETPRANRLAFQNALASWRRHQAKVDALPLECEAEIYDDQFDATLAAGRSAIAQPVHCLSDLRAKLEILFPDPETPVTGEEVTTLFADLRALTGAPSLTFDAAAWLAKFRVHGGEIGRDDSGPVLLWPDNRHMTELRWLLDTRGGLDAVHAILIAEREA